jgi:uncharacterized protein YigE (DUF2233 family)
MMTRPTSLGLALAALMLAAAPRAEAACREMTHDGLDHVVCEVAATDDLRLFHIGPDGVPLGSFARIDAVLEPQGRKLAFAMNAGMYHSDRRPVGLYIEQGQQSAPLVTSAGPGNFGMRPNGVFCILRDGGFALVESRQYAAAPPDCRDATQSGPMLVIDGALHPRFLPDSASRFVRNGIGISADGRRAVLAISRDRVNFHEFARLFRDGLQLPQALYFDGNISRLYAPGLGRDDFGFPMGPVIGVVVPR